MKTYRLKKMASAAGLFASFLLMYWGLEIVLRLIIALPHSKANVDITVFEPVMRTWKTAILLVACGIYGFVRISARHPAFNSGYRLWLWTTPWIGTDDRLLPLGPVTLGWKDAIFSAGVAWLGYSSAQVGAVMPLIAMGVPYLALGLTVLWEVKWLGVLNTIGLAAILRFWNEPMIVAGILGAMYFVFWAGVGRSLRRAAWMPEERQKLQGRDVGSWLSKIGPVELKPAMSGVNLVLLASLVGWYVYCFAYRFAAIATPQNNPVLILMTIEGAAFSLVRLGVYHSGFAPPISLLGRIFRGPLLWPSYDQVYVGPTGIAVTAAMAPILFFLLKFSVPAICGLSTAAVIMAAFGIGPALQQWRSTGAHRILILKPSNAAQRRTESRELSSISISM